MTEPRPIGLLVAKAPVPGRAKTRLAAHVGPQWAAQLAAAALLDTLDALCAAFPLVHVSLAGDLDDAVRAQEIRTALRRCDVSRQEGPDLAARLTNAHASAARDGRLVVQLGMDTPQVSGELLAGVVGLAGDDPRAAVLGPAVDGGWWVLALRDPRMAGVLRTVPMSRPDTGALTAAALERWGASVRWTEPLRDVDDVTDAEAVAGLAKKSRFGATWAELACEPRTTHDERDGHMGVPRA